VKNLKEIVDSFKITGSVSKIEAYGSGHIHDTYKVETKEAGCDNYILQGLNKDVFRNIQQLQDNISTVTNHIHRKLSAENIPDLKRRVLTVIPCKDGNTFFTDSSGSCWRMYIFISNHKTYNIVQSLKHATEAGLAIGRFQSQLADLDPKSLNETIAYFHNIDIRLEAFLRAIDKDEKGRVESVRKEIDFVLQRADEMGVILRLGNQGKIPTRITHNDTKFNNILLDINDRALCVIDLDTVMPGFIHYDFGDAIRTTASRTAEDETDLSKVELDLDLFRAYSEGYLSEIGNVLTSIEIDYLAFSPRLITFTIGLRFLTDYIDGDKYFKIHRPGHNLQRARTQFKLVESNERHYKAMQSIISDIVNKLKVS